MSMGMVLEGVCDWLRARNGWGVKECGIADGTFPFAATGQFFVGIDEDGESGGNAETNALTEVFSIEIGVWRRPGHLPKDMHGQMLVPQDRYLPEIKTLHDLERRVKVFLHHRWELVQALNTKYGLPDSGRGDNFITSLVWQSTSRKDAYVAGTSAQNAIAFVGRRLKFRGLKRVQKISTDLG